MTPASNPPDYFDDPPTHAPPTSWHTDSAPGSNRSASDYFEGRDDQQPVAPSRSPHAPWWRGRWWFPAAGSLLVLVAVGIPVFLGSPHSQGTLSVAQTVQRTSMPESEPSVAGSSGATSAGSTPAESTRTQTGTSEPSLPATVAPGNEAVLASVHALAVGSEDPWNDYSRSEFGQTWADTDRNGCDQRNDVLSRDLDDVVYRAGTRSCIVERGTFHDPYSGETIHFERGPQISQQVQIDHVVALADAWHKGAQDWSAAQRQAFANDLLNLMASKGEVNQAKSAKDASEWLPPNDEFSCAYVAKQVAVKVRYDLRVTTDERDAMVEVLLQCPGESLPQK